MRVTDDFPLVPTTCTDSKRSWGRPSSSLRSSIRSRPSFQPIGSSEFRYVSASNAGPFPRAGLSAQFGKLDLEALELLALFGHDLFGRVADEPLVAELLLGLADLVENLFATGREAGCQRIHVQAI